MEEAESECECEPAYVSDDSFRHFLGVVKIFLFSAVLCSLSLSLFTTLKSDQQL